MTQIEYLPIEQIFENEMNPRKVFTFSETKELAESIKKQGVLQPITVRVIDFNDVLDENTGTVITVPIKYQIVCGARRYKASMIAKIKTVPCIVREMTDDEAFDAMITENLQRKDVAPMDEARAFLHLHGNNVSFEELAARFGKSTTFIRLRIKLNDLIPEFIEMLESKELQISHALELCKLSSERQLQLFSDRYNDKYNTWNSWRNKPLKDIIEYLSNNFENLEHANFNKSDCEKCEFRCGVNVLFSEYDEDRCMKPECYTEKETTIGLNRQSKKQKRDIYY